MRRRSCVVAAFLALSGLVSVLSAQNGIVAGIVEDEQRNRLEGVEVQLINRRSAQVLRERTAVDGAFSFSGVRVGEHSLAFVHESYAVLRTPWFEVLPGVPVDVPAVALRKLQPPLTRPRSGLETVALEFGLVREQIADVPVLLGAEGRTAVDKLLHLVPGMNPVAMLEVDPFTGRAATVSANGSRRSFINYRLDGASNNAQNRITGAQAANFGPPPEAIETFRVVTHTYSAREGRNAGAVVLPTFRSAEEQWHGQLRAYWRPNWSRSLGSFDGSADQMNGWAGGGQITGPVRPEKKLYFLADAEGWGTDRRHDSTTEVLTNAERAGDFSAAGNVPVDPLTGVPFPQGRIPADRLDPLMQKYLETFLPTPNLTATHARTHEDLRSSGQSALAKIDKRSRTLSLHAGHYLYRNRVHEPIKETLVTTPGTIDKRRQTANNGQFSIVHTGSPNFVQTGRIAVQRLSIARRQGHSEFEVTPAREFGFEYFGENPGTIPDVTLWTDAGLPRFHIAPFLSSENSTQTTFQAGHDAEYRKFGTVVRGGFLFQRGLWPFTNTENFAGSFSFPAPPEPPVRAYGDGLRDLLLGQPGEFRLQTPRRSRSSLARVRSLRRNGSPPVALVAGHFWISGRVAASRGRFAGPHCRLSSRNAKRTFPGDPAEPAFSRRHRSGFRPLDPFDGRDQGPELRAARRRRLLAERGASIVALDSRRVRPLGFSRLVRAVLRPRHFCRRQRRGAVPSDISAVQRRQPLHAGADRGIVSSAVHRAVDKRPGEVLCPP